jgi:hypothetical protein
MFIKPTSESVEAELRRQLPLQPRRPVATPRLKGTILDDREYRLFWFAADEKPIAIHIRAHRRAKVVVGHHDAMPAPPTLFVTDACAAALRTVLHPGNAADPDSDHLRTHIAVGKGSRRFVGIDVSTLYGLMRIVLLRFLKLARGLEPRLGVLPDDAFTVSFTNVASDGRKQAKKNDVAFISILIKGISDKGLMRLVRQPENPQVREQGDEDRQAPVLADDGPVAWLARLVLQRDGGAKVSVNVDVLESEGAMMLFTHCVQSMGYALTVAAERPKPDAACCFRCRAACAPPRQRPVWCRRCMGAAYCSRECMAADADAHDPRCGNDRLTLLM